MFSAHPARTDETAAPGSNRGARGGVSEPTWKALEWTVVGCAVALTAWLAGGGRSALVLSPGDPGPWLVPWSAAAILAVLAIGSGIAGLVGRRSVGAPREQETPARPAGRWIVVLLSAGYIVVAPVIGFGVATVVFVVSFLKTTSQRWRWWSAVVAAVALTLYVVVLFEKLLQVPLPRGSIGW
ncbi:MAG: hypothetical protein KatS3mg110_2512 [Pirellulaceae bacterium]|nr:MAG: hypothetical protein KatS3mg110_2512 [Pirellulaceae bacterium]